MALNKDDLIEWQRCDAKRKELDREAKTLKEETALKCAWCR